MLTKKGTLFIRGDGCVTSRTAAVGTFVFGGKYRGRWKFDKLYFM